MKSLDFYNDPVRGALRNGSGELDLGVWWYDGERRPHRVSVVHATGEIYAARHLGSGYGEELEILGTLSARGARLHQPPCNAPCPYNRAEEILVGWAEMCGKPRSLAWVKNRIAEHETIIR